MLTYEIAAYLPCTSKYFARNDGNFRLFLVLLMPLLNVSAVVVRPMSANGLLPFAIDDKNISMLFTVSKDILYILYLYQVLLFLGGKIH